MSIVTKDLNSRVMYFIDLRNVIRGAKGDFPLDSRVDFATMVELIADGRKIVGAYIFDGMPAGENADQQRKFHHCLQHQGFRLILRESYETETREQKEVDVAMASKLLKHAFRDDFDVAVVVSGDRDFNPAVEEVKEFGKMVEVASFEKNKSNALVRNADVFHNLSALPILTLIPPAVPKNDGQEEIITGTDVTAEAM